MVFHVSVNIHVSTIAQVSSIFHVTITSPVVASVPVSTKASNWSCSDGASSSRGELHIASIPESNDIWFPEISLSSSNVYFSNKRGRYSRVSCSRDHIAIVLSASTIPNHWLFAGVTIWSWIAALHSAVNGNLCGVFVSVKSSVSERSLLSKSYHSRSHPHQPYRGVSGYHRVANVVSHVLASAPFLFHSIHVLCIIFLIWIVFPVRPTLVNIRLAELMMLVLSNHEKSNLSIYAEPPLDTVPYGVFP